LDSIARKSVAILLQTVLLATPLKNVNFAATKELAFKAQPLVMPLILPVAHLAPRAVLDLACVEFVSARMDSEDLIAIGLLIALASQYSHPTLY